MLFSTIAVANSYSNKGRLEGNIKEISRTEIDFNETLIDGRMKVPSGFFIQGRQAQAMSQMVKLRSNFRKELKKSKNAVKVITKNKK